MNNEEHEYQGGNKLRISIACDRRVTKSCIRRPAKRIQIATLLRLHALTLWVTQKEQKLPVLLALARYEEIRAEHPWPKE